LGLGTVVAVLGLVMVGVFLIQLLLHLKEREQSEAVLIQEERDKAALAVHLHEAQQLETLGVLAGGVAHDFNNLLTSILGNANLGSMKAETGADMAPCFAAIESAAMRAAELTRLLLAYAGKGKYLVTAVDLRMVVEETTSTCSVSIPAGVTLQCELAEGGTLVKGDAIQIRQILINLLANAVEAIADGHEGRISIRTGTERVVQATTKSECCPLPVGPGQYGTLEVADTGAGMPPEVLARAFEPFFTTKFAGRGLGLAAVIGILRSHEGGLEVRTAPGQGSTLKAFLPALPPSR
jgi:signal transduction histidine kinase